MTTEETAGRLKQEIQLRRALIRIERRDRRRAALWHVAELLLALAFVGAMAFAWLQWCLPDRPYPEVHAGPIQQGALEFPPPMPVPPQRR